MVKPSGDHLDNLIRHEGVNKIQKAKKVDQLAQIGHLKIVRALEYLDSVCEL